MLIDLCCLLCYGSTEDQRWPAHRGDQGGRISLLTLSACLLLRQAIYVSYHLVINADGSEVLFRAVDLDVLHFAALGGVEAAFGLSYEVELGFGLKHDRPVRVVGADWSIDREPRGELDVEADIPSVV